MQTGVVHWRLSELHVKDALPTQKRWNVVFYIPSAHMDQTESSYAWKYQSAVRRRDDNSLLALHCLTASHAFGWTRASDVGSIFYSDDKGDYRRNTTQRTGQHPWLHPEWKILSTRIGYNLNIKYVRRFRCKDNNDDLMCVQPHY